ncbi:hypothetical protein [Nocardiopsis algeriensis]|uniref:Uncharacterized protein n=1 Tax=Nocardiopsis algeriensis TaxID=1478215 RepID=A0A841IPK5_9ACTN|nr:hypothetical protein [Nocardiopsis algeriensis]MBB6119196.1 hypothetical protein [Nocardiopsis algeriensis]
MTTTAIAWTVGTVLALIWALPAGKLLLLSLRGPSGLADRWDALARLFETGFLMAVSLAVVVWTVFPVAVWYVLTALTAAAAGAAVLRLPDLPARADDAKASRRRLSALGNLALLAGFTALIAVVP